MVKSLFSGNFWNENAHYGGGEVLVCACFVVVFCLNSILADNTAGHSVPATVEVRGFQERILLPQHKENTDNFVELGGEIRNIWGGKMKSLSF